MCKRYIYLRVSTDDQRFEQQMQEIKNYGINPDEVDGIVREHESGGKSYVDRELKKLLNKCRPGDYIYAGSTDRLGRSFTDMIRLMEESKKKGVIIVACKQQISLSDDNPFAKLLLSITSILDEDERNRIRRRTQNKVDWQREQIERQGYYIIENGPNAGKRKYKMGPEKGHDTSAARQASAKSNADALIEWRETSIAYRWTMQKVASGVPRKEIIEEFNRNHELQPEVFCTRKGGKLSKGLLSHWISMENPLAVSAKSD